MMLKNNNYNQLSLMKKSFNKVDNGGDGLDDTNIISFLARSDKSSNIKITNY